MVKNEVDCQLDQMLVALVERCLQEIWQRHELLTDDDGDFPFHRGAAAAWVKVVTGPNPGVRVFAHAAFGLKRTAKLLVELNDISARNRFVNIYEHNGNVIVESDLLWTSVGRQSLEHVMSVVCEVADSAGPMIAAVFGGQVPFAEADDVADAEPGEAA